MDAVELAYAGISRQAQLIASGEVSSRELVDLYLERIEHLDGKLNCFRVVFGERARVEADQADGRRGVGGRRPLGGVPIAVKDDIDVAGEVTAFGTNAHGGPVRADAEVLRRLRAAGAVVIGKTNVPELTIWPFTESATFGVTRNPWDPSRSPGGSSGGTAAAVAAGLAPFGLGSDGGGSIRTPATWCGLYGIKPQRDRVPLAPHDGAWNGLSVNGPMARTVEDAALFLDVTSTTPAPQGSFVAAARRGPGRLRIALSAKVPPMLTARVGTAQRAALDDAGALLRQLGHHVISRDPDYPTGAAYGHLLPRYFRGVHDDVQSLPRKERLERRTRAMARIGGLFSDRRMAAIRKAETTLTQRVLSIFGDVD